MGHLCQLLQAVSVHQEIDSGIDGVKQLKWKNKKITVEMKCKLGKAWFFTLCLQLLLLFVVTVKAFVSIPPGYICGPRFHQVHGCHCNN